MAMHNFDQINQKEVWALLFSQNIAMNIRGNIHMGSIKNVFNHYPLKIWPLKSLKVKDESSACVCPKKVNFKSQI